MTGILISPRDHVWAWLRWLSRAAGIVMVVCWTGLGAQVQAQTTAHEPLPPKVEELLKLLADPAIQKWLEAQKKQPAPAAATPTGPRPIVISERIAAVQRHIVGLLGAIPAFPGEIMNAQRTLMADMSAIGPIRFLLLIGIFVALGLGAQWLYGFATKWPAAGVAALPVATARQRLTAIVACLLLNLGRVAAFALGSVGAFVALAWPALLREIVVSFLVAIVGIRLAHVLLVTMLSPPARGDHPSPQALRITPIGDPNAAFWTKKLTALVAIFAIGFAAVISMRQVGFSPQARYLIAYLFGLGLLATAVNAVWKSPRAMAESGAPSASNVARWLLTVYFALLWVLWAAHAMPLFWLIVVAALLPAAFRFVQPSIMRIAQPQADADAANTAPSVALACLERGLRAVFIVLAILILAWAWEVPLGEMTQTDTFAQRAVRGVMSAIIILMVADFIWHIARTAIDLRIAEAARLGKQNSDEAQKQARLRTVLPLLRIVLMVVLATVAALTALASLGVQIGPLIAGAGIVGVAVGFGSQQLVRDVVSGVFYLLDDAFRVGDYIIAGNYKGTVESFSLRSVRLRHHNGPIFTVPFGMLGAVQNTSRDWVVEKFTIGVTYDTDVEKARKIIKKIGLELAEDPEFKNSVIEPLKMQGVDTFGDYAIKLRLKIMTKPNEQYGVKRKAMVRIKQAFEENGIKFAYPTVQVAGGTGPAEGAAASAALPRPQAAE